MPTALITGSNRGLGLEFTRQYAADGWRVHACCRDPAGAAALAALDGDISIHALDVADQGSPAELAQSLGDTPIDLLLNNAGIYGPSAGTFGAIDYDAWAQAFRVNTMGPMRMAECFAGAVAASRHKLIVSITSQMGSIAGNSQGGAHHYRTSKAALNAAMHGLAIELKPRGVTIALLHPGWVQTDMGGASATLPVPDSVTALRRVIAGLQPVNTGGFFNYDGTPIPW